MKLMRGTFRSKKSLGIYKLFIHIGKEKEKKKARWNSISTEVDIYPIQNKAA